MNRRRQTALMPKPPKWALAAGLPKPDKGEDFCAYVTRLGLNPDWLLEGLTDRTKELANLRLDSQLTRSLPEVYAKYVAARTKAARR